MCSDNIETNFESLVSKYDVLSKVLTKEPEVLEINLLLTDIKYVHSSTLEKINSIHNIGLETEQNYLTICDDLNHCALVFNEGIEWIKQEIKSIARNSIKCQISEIKKLIYLT